MWLYTNNHPRKHLKLQKCKFDEWNLTISYLIFSWQMIFVLLLCWLSLPKRNWAQQWALATVSTATTLCAITSELRTEEQSTHRRVRIDGQQVWYCTPRNRVSNIWPIVSQNLVTYGGLLWPAGSKGVHGGSWWSKRICEGMQWLMGVCASPWGSVKVHEGSWLSTRIY